VRIDVIYDDNGSVCANIFGCPPGVLGLGGFLFIFTGSPEPASGLVLMNGAAVAPGDNDGEDFRVVFTQEVGHAIGLHHDQTNGAISFFGDNSAPGGTLAAPECPSLSKTPKFEDFTAMYPFASISPTGPGEEAASIDHPEDLNSISRFYPDPGKGKKGKRGYAATTVTIAGTVFASDGVTPVDGVNIIVRNVEDPFEDARSTVSGDLSCTSGCIATGFFTDGFTGTFILTGLEPGEQYTLAVDNIVAGSFAQTPAPTFIEEFWNGVSESSNPAVDDRCDFVTISGSAGDVIPIVVILNGPPLAKTFSSSAESLPISFGLDFNYPNPFNPETKINYQFPEASNVVIKVFNMKGQLVRTLIDEFKEPGSYTVVWDGRNVAGLSVPSGAYFYKMKAGNFQETRKMVLLK